MLFGYHSDKIKEILKSVYGEKFSYVPFVDNEDRRIAQMFGWNREQIINAINVYETRQAKEKKMTREEAYSKVLKASEAMTYTHQQLETTLNTLEALGLIKFEEEKTADDKMIDAVILNFNSYKSAENFINGLYISGYKIVKKD